MAKQGVETAKLGRRIRAILDGHPNGRNFTFYYDHGGQKECPDDVARIKGFAGTDVKRVNILTLVDLMLADSKGNILMLIEVEEGSVHPKRALGNVLPLLLCDRCAVRCKGKQRYFEITADTKLCVVGKMPEKGDRIEKIGQVIEPRLHQMTGFANRLRPQNVYFVFDIELEYSIAAIVLMVQEIVEN